MLGSQGSRTEIQQKPGSACILKGKLALLISSCLILLVVSCSPKKQEESPKVSQVFQGQQDANSASGDMDLSLMEGTQKGSAAAIWMDIDKESASYLADATNSVPVLARAEMTRDFFEPYDTGKYRVSIGDVLEISIFGHTDTINREVPVAPDGKLYYYFTEGISAEGKSIQEIEHDIESRLGHLFNTPEVSIIPRRVVSSKYTILGKVKIPGSYYIQSATTLRQAIGEAGGFAEGGYRGTSINTASLKNSFVIRDGKRLPIDFEKLMGVEDVENDIYVRPGDYIYIASALMDEVHRVGAFREPRSVSFEDGLTLVGLVSGRSGIGGGYLPEAHIRQIIIVRGAIEDPQVSVVNLEAILEGKEPDIYLQSGDIVYIPNKPYRWLRQLVRVAIYSYVTSFTGTAGTYYGEELFRAWSRDE